MHAGAMTLVDLETDLSVEELQRYICDHFFFSGTVEIDGEIKIVRKGDLDVEEQKRRLIAAE